MTVGSCPVNARCVMGLLSSAQLRPLLFGLKVVDRQLEVEVEKFVCCEGSGGRYDKELNAVRRCDIQRRKRRLEQLLTNMQMSWPESEVGDLGAINERLLGDVEERWHKFVFAGRQAWAFRVEPYAGPSWLWSAAAMCIWRLGLNCEVISFSSPRYKHAQVSGANNPDLIFVEGVRKLTDPKRALHLEEIIAQTYNSNTRLVTEFFYSDRQIEAAKADNRRGFSTKGMLSNRVEKLKRQDPLLFLEPNSRSRLQSMCTNPRVE